MFFLDEIKNSDIPSECEMLGKARQKWWDLYRNAESKFQQRFILDEYRKEVKKMVHGFLVRVGYEINMRAITIDLIEKFTQIIENQVSQAPQNVDAGELLFLRMYGNFFRMFLNLRKCHLTGYNI